MRLLFILFCLYLLGQAAHCSPFKTKGQAKAAFKKLIRDNSLAYTKVAANIETTSRAEKLSKDLEKLAAIKQVPQRTPGQLVTFYQDVTWYEAKYLCEEDGGYLGAPKNLAENQRIVREVKHRSLTGKHAVWTGLNDLAREGHFLLANNKPSPYLCFLRREPNNNKNREDCVEIRLRYGGGWNDNRCWLKRPAYICRY